MIQKRNRSSFHQPCDEPLGSVCASAGGIPGVESPEKYMEIGHVCCLEECGECGGSGCRERTGNANDCCMTNIADEGRDCSVANEAPCFITAGKRKRNLGSAVISFGSARSRRCSITTQIIHGLQALVPRPTGSCCPEFSRYFVL